MHKLLKTVLGYVIPVYLHSCTFFHETKVGLVEEKVTYRMPSELFGGKRGGSEWGKAVGGFIVCPTSQYMSKCKKENSKTVEEEKYFFSHQRQEKITKVRN